MQVTPIGTQTSNGYRCRPPIGRYTLLVAQRLAADRHHATHELENAAQWDDPGNPHLDDLTHKRTRWKKLLLIVRNHALAHDFEDLFAAGIGIHTHNNVVSVFPVRFVPPLARSMLNYLKFDFHEFFDFFGCSFCLTTIRPALERIALMKNWSVSLGMLCATQQEAAHRPVKVEFIEHPLNLETLPNFAPLSIITIINLCN